VCRVLHKGDRTTYILKAVNRLLYIPDHSDIIRTELENLEQFKGVTGIVQPAGIAVFTNQYATSQTCFEQMVISGVLFECNRGGSLKCVLNEQRVKESG
jgi:hypothetical protein